MRNYELVVVLKAALKEEDRKKILDTIKEWLKGANVKEENDWGQKPLAYEIKHEAAGHYIQLVIESEEGLAKDLETRIFRQEGVLRHLLLRTK